MFSCIESAYERVLFVDNGIIEQCRNYFGNLEGIPSARSSHICKVWEGLMYVALPSREAVSENRIRDYQATMGQLYCCTGSALTLFWKPVE